MEKAVLRKIPISEAGQYIKSSKNLVTMGGVLSLKPKNSVVVFDFSKTEATSCKLKFRRDSGNGLLLSHCAGKNVEHQIVSKSGQDFTLPLGPRKDLHLHRTTRSNGIVSISEIILYGEKVANWNALLKRCDEHGCLRLVGDDLFASEGGFVKGPGIVVKTDPPDAFKQEDDLIKFVKSCKITSLSIDGDNKLVNTNERVFRSVVFDTKDEGFSQDFCNSHAKAEGGCAVIDRRGSISIPLTGVVPNQSYNITVFASNIDGNGKMIFGLLPNTGESAYTLLGNKIKESKMTVTPSGGGNYFVSVWRHPSSKGRIRVQRVVVEKKEGELVSEPREIRHITLSGVEQDQPVPTFVPQKSVISEPITAITTSPGPEAIDKVEAASRQFAIFQTPPVQAGATDAKGSVAVKGHKARLWLSRLQSMYPNVKDNASSALVICDVHNVVPAQKVWLEEFSGGQLRVLDSLAQAKVIYTPSLKNKVLLSDAFPRATIEVVPLPLPRIHSRGKTENYFLYVENNKEDTQHLLSVFDPKRLCIVGTKVTIPKGTRYISEYDLYTNLSLALSKAKGLIDLSVNTHFRSGLVELALGMGVPVLTNNHQYIGKAKVVRHTRTEKVSQKALNDGIASLKFSEEETTYNDKVLGTLKQLGVL